LMSDVERLIGAMLPAAKQFDRAERLTYAEAIQLHAGVDAFRDLPAVLVARLESEGIDVPLGLHRDRDACLDLIVSTLVGPQLGLDRLTFIYDYPASQAALARVRGPVASRFEAYLNGVELANGFHELGDSIEQRSRFEKDLVDRAARGLPAVPLDTRFLAGLAHGLPECSGVALGFDRLVMCATDAKHLDEVLAFPFERA
jgi:elongation factor P--(R)-beta-lysine ligase